MKLKKIVKNSLATTLVFATVVGASGCVKDKNKNNKPKEFDLKKVIDKNMEKEETVEVVNDGVTGYVEKKSFSTKEGTQVINDYNSYGLLVVENEAGYVGFYSLHYQKYLLAPQFVKEWLSYNVYTDFEVGYFIKLQYKGVYYIYDSLGNLVYQSERIINVRNTEEVNKEIYITIEEYSETLSDYEVATIKKYKKDGKLEEVEFIPQQVEINEEEEDVETDEPLEFGDLFVSQSKIDLKEYGIEGKYALKEGNMYTIFNSSDNSRVNTISIPTSAHILIGDSIIYQTETMVPEEAKDYTYFSNGEKYLLKTYSLDILTGKEKEIRTNYKVNVGTNYKDENGVYKYGLAIVLEIKDKVLMASQKTYIIDGKGDCLKDITDYKIEYLTKIGINYYNEKTKIIYNRELKEVAYIGDIEPIHMKDDEVFVGRENGKWGAINYEGKVAIPFIYDSLEPLEQGKGIDFKESCLIARKGTNYYRVNKRTGEETDLGTRLELIYEDLYMQRSETNDKLSFISQSEKYTEFSINFNDLYTQPSTYKMTLNKLLGEYVITKVQTRVWDESDSQYHTTTTYLSHAIKGLANANDFVTIGEEKTEMEAVGISEEDAIVLNLGENKVHVRGEVGTNNASYLSFTPSKSGKYILEFEDAPLTDSYNSDFDIYNEEESIVYDVMRDENNSIVVDLKANSTYYIKGVYDVDTYKYTNINVKENTGEFFAHPLTFENPIGIMNIDYTNLNSDSLYVEFTPIVTTSYNIKINEGAEFIMNVTNDDFDSSLLLTSTTQTLTKDVKKVYRIVKDVAIQSNNIEFTIELTNKEKDGSTILNSIELSQESISINNESSNSKFYVYTHSGEEKFLTFKFKEVTGTPILNTYLDSLKKFQETNLESNESLACILSDGEKIYFEVIGETTTSATVKKDSFNTINSETGLYEKVSMDAANPYNLFKFVPTSSKVYGFDVGGTDYENPNLMINITDENYNSIATYAAPVNGMQAVTSNPLEEGETYYIIIMNRSIDLSQANHEYTLTYKEYDLYSVENVYEENAFVENSDGTITFGKKNMSSSISFTASLKITVNENVSVSFDYEVNRFTQSASAGSVVITENGSLQVFLTSESNVSKTQYSSDVDAQTEIEIKVNKSAFYAASSSDVDPIIKISNLVIKLK